MQLFENLSAKKIILGSKSPRRQQLLQGLNIDFEVRTKDTDESFDDQLKGADIPLYLCRKKAEACKSELSEHEILITADTIVWINDRVLNKPSTREEAIIMIRELSGKTHSVFTAVCIANRNKEVIFHDETLVTFMDFEEEEIAFYVDNYSPYDKAGGYGAQDWLGLAGILSISGSYFNVMGLPVHLVYAALKGF